MHTAEQPQGEERVERLVLVAREDASCRAACLRIGGATGLGVTLSQAQAAACQRSCAAKRSAIAQFNTVPT